MSAWREELHPRDTKGEFAKGGNSWVGKLSQRMGSDMRSANRAQIQNWWDGLSGDDKSTVRETITSGAKQPTNIRLSLQQLQRLLDGKPLQTSHDTGHKGSGYDAQRQAWEEAHGLDHPSYGYVGAPGSLDLYADHEITLKPSARSRTTVSVGDSLNGETDVTPINDVRKLSDDQLLDLVSPVETQPGGLANGRFKQFMEAQVSGGIRLSDVAQVHVPSDTPDDIVKALKKAGIKVNIQLSEEELALEAARRKLGLI